MEELNDLTQHKYEVKEVEDDPRCYICHIKLLCHLVNVIGTMFSLRTFVKEEQVVFNVWSFNCLESYAKTLL